MKKETELEVLQRKVRDLEQKTGWMRESDVRMWKAIQTICKYLNIELDENVVGIMLLKREVEK